MKFIIHVENDSCEFSFTKREWDLVNLGAISKDTGSLFIQMLGCFENHTVAGGFEKESKVARHYLDVLSAIQMLYREVKNSQSLIDYNYSVKVIADDAKLGLQSLTYGDGYEFGVEDKYAANCFMRLYGTTKEGRRETGWIDCRSKSEVSLNGGKILIKKKKVKSDLLQKLESLLSVVVKHEDCEEVCIERLV